jgi:hypothetical protein
MPVEPLPGRSPVAPQTNVKEKDMATKAQYPYHGGQPKAGAGAGREAGSNLMGPKRPSTGGQTAPTPKANQPKTPFVKMHK